MNSASHDDDEDTNSSTFGGGMNPETGFPVYFTEVSSRLGRYDTTFADMSAIARRYGPETHPRVLDVCCGIGRTSSALSHLGFDVTGIDLSAEQIEMARTLDKGPHHFVADMADPPPGPFDILVNVYTSFGYFKTEAEDMALLRVWHDRLRPGGVLIMELADMEKARHRIPGSGTLIRSTNGVTEVLRMNWTLRLLDVEYEFENRTWNCLTRLYEKEFLASALRDIGFVSVEVFGSFDGRPKTEDDNLVLIAIK